MKFLNKLQKVKPVYKPVEWQIEYDKAYSTASVMSSLENSPRRKKPMTF
jgi:hypothetical protein